MTVDSDSLDAQIGQWRAYMRRRRAVHDVDVDELEDHLRSTVADLVEAGLRPDEAFLVAVKRMGNLDDLSREFARVHSERLWKQLVLAGDTGAPAAAGMGDDRLVMAGCAVAAAVAIKIPELFGVSLSEDTDFYIRNLALFALVPLAAYFALRRRLGIVWTGLVAGLFVVGALAANAYPTAEGSQSVVLTAIHLPLALWLAVGLAYVGGDWRSDRKRMDFIRFTGEFIIYSVLISLGTSLLSTVVIGVFDAIGVDLDTVMGLWVLPCSGLAAVVVAAWLVEAKQSVIENMAPVLTRLFTPLFTVAVLAFLVAVAWTGELVDVDRDVLILFDVLLVTVLGLFLYALSARDPDAPPKLFDRLQLAMVASALLIDALVLFAVLGRISEWGNTPNKATALGVNAILLANLGWTAFLLAEFVRRRRPFAEVERWQTRYLAAYAAWAWAVVLVFPPAFDYF
ncbi:permease prefix domain 1-containing protein [Asanoa sp. NPDC050611]|uniref:permease prefix domain 1-containing protein n=1 Tax=Asanoa sp. NPDC050611 TaxID=3157098 RepID=UPI0033C4AF18